MAMVPTIGAFGIRTVGLESPSGVFKLFCISAGDSVVEVLLPVCEVAVWDVAVWDVAVFGICAG